MLTTGLITQTVPMPTCRYEVLQNDRTGLPLRFARIGELAYHQWVCDGPTGSLHSILRLILLIIRSVVAIFVIR